MRRDLRVLKSVLPPSALRVLRRLRGLGHRITRLRYRMPAARRAAATQEVAALPARPLISLVMPTYKTELRWLREAVESVVGQHYPEWELIVVDDGSGSPELDAACRAHAAADPRIVYLPLAQNAGISGATNEGLAIARGEFVGFLDHDDTLTDDALLRVAQVLAADPELDVIYSDSDKLTVKNIRADPFLKPDWSPVYALGAMYIGHLLVVRTSVAKAAGGFDSNFNTIQDFEFMMRVSEHTDRIHHIPQILYHWRAIPGSIAAGTDQKAGVEELQARAVSQHLERLGVAAQAVPHEKIPHRAKLAPLDGGAATPAVSVVVAARRPRPRPRPRPRLAARAQRLSRARADRRHAPARRARRQRAAPPGSSTRARAFTGPAPTTSAPPRRAAITSSSSPATPRSSTPTGSSSCCCTPPCRASPRSGRCWCGPRARSPGPAGRSACATRRRRCWPATAPTATATTAPSPAPARSPR